MWCGLKRQQRRIALVVGIVLLLIIWAGATAWVFREPLMSLVPTPPLVITEKDQGRTIHMIVGERLEVRLPSNVDSGSTWRAGMPLSFLPQSHSAAFHATPGAAKAGDGYEALTFIATGKGIGPLFIGYMPDNDQNSFQPSRSFSVIVTVQ